MSLEILSCGDHPHRPPGARLLPRIPTRQDLRFLDELAHRLLPEDPTPSLAEITQRPDVPHLGAPQPAPQHPSEPLRVVVIGTDASLAAVLTRLMRGDYLWAEVGFVPVPDPHSAAPASVAARNWGLPESIAEAVSFATSAPTRPSPLIRTDSGLAVAGSATISHWEGREFTGEIVVDNHRLVLHEDTGARFHGVFGARLVPTTTAPGIMAATAVSPVAAPSVGDAATARAVGDGATARTAGDGATTRTAAASGGTPASYGAPGRARTSRLSSQQLQAFSRLPLLSAFTRRTSPHLGEVDPSSVVQGRAVQAGGVNLAITVDGVRGPRPQKRAVFYRHLRDLQVVRA